MTPLARTWESGAAERRLWGPGEPWEPGEPGGLGEPGGSGETGGCCEPRVLPGGRRWAGQAGEAAEAGRQRISAAPPACACETAGHAEWG